MTTPKGGARPGAGRKPKAEKYARPINAAEKKIADHLPLIVDALLELAQGVHVEATTPEGEPIVYQKPPDRGAAEYLLDRIMGKPMQRQEISGDATKPIVVKVLNGASMDEL